MQISFRFIKWIRIQVIDDPELIFGAGNLKKFLLLPVVPSYKWRWSTYSNLFVYIYFHLNCNLLSCRTSPTLHISALQGHHQVHLYLAKTVALHIEIKFTYRMWTRFWLIIIIYLEKCICKTPLLQNQYIYTQILGATKQNVSPVHIGGKEVRRITKLLHDTQIKIAFRI